MATARWKCNIAPRETKAAVETLSRIKAGGRTFSALLVYPDAMFALTSANGNVFAVYYYGLVTQMPRYSPRALSTVVAASVANVNPNMNK